MSNLSKSKIEEIIGCLWAIIWVLLWVHDAHHSLVWVAGFFTISSFFLSVLFAGGK